MVPDGNILVGMWFALEASAVMGKDGPVENFCQQKLFTQKKGGGGGGGGGLRNDYLHGNVMRLVESYDD